jgi:hypothetical protein
LVVFTLLVVAVAMIALADQNLSWAQIGFARTSWRALPQGIMLALFFILVFGPAAAAVIAKSGLAGFEVGQRPLLASPAGTSH